MVMKFDYKTYNKPLYHGSKGGIEGEISVKSPNKNRENNPCDFGKGFYIGTNKEQAKGVCIEDAHPVLYTLYVDFKQIPDKNILTLNDEQWLYTILACRKKSERFANSPLANDIRKIVDSYDIVIGTIADDRMNEAIREFNQNHLTTVGLEKCLEYIDYGVQIVIKSQEKVNKIVEFLSDKPLYGFEADNVRNNLYKERAKSKSIVDEMALKYRKDGYILEEIIDKAQRGEILAKDIFPEYYQKQSNQSGDDGNQDGTESFGHKEKEEENEPHFPEYPGDDD